MMLGDGNTENSALLHIELYCFYIRHYFIICIFTCLLYFNHSCFHVLHHFITWISTFLHVSCSLIIPVSTCGITSSPLEIVYFYLISCILIILVSPSRMTLSPVNSAFPHVFFLYFNHLFPHLASLHLHTHKCQDQSHHPACLCTC